jgi:hypothetical protein
MEGNSSNIGAPKTGGPLLYAEIAEPIPIACVGSMLLFIVVILLRILYFIQSKKRSGINRNENGVVTDNINRLRMVL